jgi:hypothetical protein
MDVLRPEGTNSSLRGSVEVLQRLATVAPRGSQHAFASGQILNPYATRYRQPFAFSTVPYPLTRQVVLRLPCHAPKREASDGAYHVPLSTDVAAQPQRLSV